MKAAVKKVKTTQERQAEARLAKLAHVEEQVASGGLVIRQMTKAERDKWEKRRSAHEADVPPAEQRRRGARR
jgi:hypothetical protein